jgi:hypothetical protein
MNARLFHEFLASDDSLWVYKDRRRLFASTKSGISPLLEYMETLAPHHRQITIFDKVVGNAAALLSIKAAVEELNSPLGSELAVKTLRDYGVKYHFSEIAPYIQNRRQDDMCPMEKLSIGRSPEEFFELASKQFKHKEM